MFGYITFMQTYFETITLISYVDLITKFFFTVKKSLSYLKIRDKMYYSPESENQIFQ